MSAGSLPARSCVPATADFVEITGWDGGDFVGAECYYQRSDLLRFEGLDHFFRHDASGHVCASVGGNGIDVDVVFGTFSGQGSRKAKDTALLRLDQHVASRKVRERLTAAA